MNYLGSFGPPEKRLAVFTDGKTIHNALEGEVLDNKFIVAHIGYESVDIQFVGFPDVARPAARRRPPQPLERRNSVEDARNPSCGLSPCWLPWSRLVAGCTSHQAYRQGESRRLSAATGTRRCCNT